MIELIQITLQLLILVVCFRLEKARMKQLIDSYQRRLYTRYVQLSPEQQTYRCAQEYLKYTKYPLVVVSQIPLLRRWYFANLAASLKELDALQTRQSEK